VRIRNFFFRLVKLLGTLNLKPVVFLHLQKTAGTSIVDIARQFYGNDNVISHSAYLLGTNDLLSNEKSSQNEHSQDILTPIQFISGHFGYDVAKQFMGSHYSFTFLRNPVERILSFYYFCRIRDPNQFKHHELAHRLSLDEFLELGFTDRSIKAHIWNYQVSQLATGWGSTSGLVLNDAELLASAIQHLDDFSYIGFTETYDKDQDKILKDIGITIPVGKHKSNANPERPLFDDLPQSSKDLLMGLTELDRALYEKAWSKRNP
jgi:hypothetical protein